jgi:hypothetical protein
MTGCVSTSGLLVVNSEHEHMSNSRIEAAIHALNGKRLERLMTDILEREGYQVDPTGTSGPDGGREALLTDGDRDGILHCSVQQDDWVGKAHDDAEKAAENFDQDFDQFVFATTQDPAGVKRDRVEEELATEWGMQTTIWDYERIRNELVGNQDNHDLVREHLSVDPNRPFVDVEEQVNRLYGDLLERVKHRESPDGPITEEGAIVAVHVIPQEAIDDHHDRYVKELPHPPQFEKRDCYPTDRPKVKITENNQRLHDGSGHDRYTAIHRDGWTEGVLTARFPPEKQKNGRIRKSIDHLIVNFVNTALGSFDEVDIYPPYYVHVAVLDGEDYTLNHRKLGGPPGRKRVFGDDEIRLNRVRIDDTDTDVPEAMRQSLNQLWRYCGWNRSIHYESKDEGDVETEWEFQPRR